MKVEENGDNGKDKEAANGNKNGGGAGKSPDKANKL